VVEELLPDLTLERLRHAKHHPRSREFQHLQDNVDQEDHKGEHLEGARVAAIDHAIVDLEHVPAWGQHEEVDEEAKKENLPEMFGERFIYRIRTEALEQ
jgi:hypothetical protein